MARCSSCAACRGIVDYEPSELVVTARSGTPLSEIEASLAEHGQFLAFEPPAFGGDATLGGVIAAGLSGPRRMYAGAARDFVLGDTLLTGSGEQLRFGGQVMKNVAGFDVSRLLCGSLGILGIITEVSLKVLPRPRAEATVRLELSAAAAVAAFNRWAAQPLPLSAAAWWQGQAWVRLSGAAPAVRSARERIGGELIDSTRAPGVVGRTAPLPPSAVFAAGHLAPVRAGHRRTARAARRATDRLGRRAALVRRLTRCSGGACRLQRGRRHRPVLARLCAAGTLSPPGPGRRGTPPAPQGALGPGGDFQSGAPGGRSVGASGVSALPLHGRAPSR